MEEKRYMSEKLPTLYHAIKEAIKCGRVLKPIDQLPDNLFLLRSVKFPDLFVHWSEDKKHYVFEPGEIHACTFTEENADLGVTKFNSLGILDGLELIIEKINVKELLLLQQAKEE